MTDLRHAVVEEVADALAAAWTIIANVSGGDWRRQPPAWQAEAERWRDEVFHPFLGVVYPPVPWHEKEVPGR